MILMMKRCQIDDEEMDNDLVRVVKRTEDQTRRLQTTFAVLLAKWKERPGSTSPLGELKSQTAKHHMSLRSMSTAAHNNPTADS
jgi:hypothetical protein